MLCLVLAGQRRAPPSVVSFSSERELAAYLPQSANLALYFTAEYNATTGRRWCGDSEEVNDLVFSRVLPSLPHPVVVVVVEVSRQHWKHSSLYRGEPYFLKEIPSLVLVSSGAPVRVLAKADLQRLEEAEGGKINI